MKVNDKKLAARILLGIVTAGSLYAFSGTAEAVENSVALNKTPENDSSNVVVVTDEHNATVNGTAVYSEEPWTEAYGGRGWTPSGNTITINGGNFNGDTDYPKTIYGGDSNQDKNDVCPPDGMELIVSENTVTINGSTEVEDVIGGNAIFDADKYTYKAVKNTVNVCGGTMNTVTGGKAAGKQSIASYNTVNISGGEIKAVYGGASGGQAVGNRVNISGGKITSEVCGGDTRESNGGDVAKNNVVAISGGTIEGWVLGAYVAGTATDNTVSISGTPTLSKAHLFGSTNNSGSGNNLLLNNTATVEVNSIQYFNTVVLDTTAAWGTTLLTVNGTMDVTGTNVDASKLKVTAAQPLSEGEQMTLIGHTGDGQISEWKKNDGTYDITQPETKLTWSVEGSGAVLQGSNEAVVDVNETNRDLVYRITSAPVTEEINITQPLSLTENGEVLKLPEGNYDFTNTKFAEGSKVTKEDAELSAPEGILLSTDNKRTLIDGSAEGVEVTGLDAFAADNLPYHYTTNGVTVKGMRAMTTDTAGTSLVCGISSIDSITYGSGLTWKTGGTLLSVEAGKGYDLSKTVVDTTNIGFTADSLATITTVGGHAMTLLDTKGNTTLAASNLKAKETDYAVGTALAGKGTASLAANGNVMYTITTAPKETDQPHAAAMAASAGIAAVSSSAAASVDTAMGVLASAPAGSTTGFAGFGAGTSKYKTGSDVQSTMWQGTFGAGTKKELKDGASLAWGAFFECGRGSYTTHNEHAKYTRGDGRMNYLGGGLTARYTTPSKFYTEMSVHAGRLTNDADRVLADAVGNTYGYKSRTNYYGISLGLGRSFELSDKKSYDVYGTFYYNRNGSDSFNAGTDRYDLDAVNSKLLRLGVRYNQRMSDSAKLYAGLAFDYEFDGRSGGTVTNGSTKTAIRSSDIKGASGMLELGVALKAPDSPWELDLGAKAYAGRHQGFSGNVGIKYLF